MPEVLRLIKQTTSTDSLGDPTVTETAREVFVELKSIGQKEFYQAMSVGLQPEIAFRLADYLDYEGERYVEYDGQRLRVLRTFRKGQELELVCYREVNPDGST